MIVTLNECKIIHLYYLSSSTILYRFIVALFTICDKETFFTKDSLLLFWIVLMQLSEPAGLVEVGEGSYVLFLGSTLI
jgi:hypothetical protein